MNELLDIGLVDSPREIKLLDAFHHDNLDYTVYDGRGKKRACTFKKPLYSTR